MTGQPSDLPAEINTSTAHPARMYDYYLGGKDNYPADRRAAEQVLAAEARMRQFVDIGTGLPTSPNVHQIAQAVTPDARVVYIDNDPIVHVHANALLAGEATSIVLADLRQPDAILDHPTLRRRIDLTQPVALLLVAILHFLGDDEDPAGIVARLRDRLADGSYVVISHATADFDRQAAAAAARAYDQAAAPMVLRSHAEIERLFDGFELVDPGLVQVSRWRPDDQRAAAKGEVWAYGGVGRRDEAGTTADAAIARRSG